MNELLNWLKRRVSGEISIRHLTPFYIKDRLRVWWYERRNPGHPWLTQDAISFLHQWLKKSDAGIEWGSGRSTIWLAGHVGHLISVENNREWYDRVDADIRSRGVDNIRYRFHPTDGLSRESESDSAYVQEVKDVADASLDFALVDGWARVHCCHAVLSKLKSRGLLVLDNANWYLTPPAHLTHPPCSRSNSDGALPALWQHFVNQTADWRQVWTSNGITCTLLLFKP